MNAKTIFLKSRGGTIGFMASADGIDVDDHKVSLHWDRNDVDDLLWALSARMNLYDKNAVVGCGHFGVAVRGDDPFDALGNTDDAGVVDITYVKDGVQHDFAIYAYGTTVISALKLLTEEAK